MKSGYTKKDKYCLIPPPTHEVLRMAKLLATESKKLQGPGREEQGVGISRVSSFSREDEKVLETKAAMVVEQCACTQCD